MVDLKKIILLSLGCAVVYFLVSFATKKATGPLTGSWEETYFNVQAEPMITDGFYELRQTSDQIAISHKAQSKEVFSHIHLTDRMFTFQRTKYTDSVELIMAYNLEPNDDWSALYGSYYSSEGREVRVVWNKKMKKGRR